MGLRSTDVSLPMLADVLTCGASSQSSSSSLLRYSMILYLSVHHYTIVYFQLLQNAGRFLHYSNQCELRMVRHHLTIGLILCMRIKNSSSSSSCSDNVSQLERTGVSTIGNISELSSHDCHSRYLQPLICWV